MLSIGNDCIGNEQEGPADVRLQHSRLEIGSASGASLSSDWLSQFKFVIFPDFSRAYTNVPTIPG